MQSSNRTIYVAILAVFIVLSGMIFYFESQRLSNEDLAATVDAQVAAILTDADFESTNVARAESLGLTAEAQRPIVLTDVALAYPSDTPTATDTATNTPTNTATFTPTNTATNTATFTPTNTATFTATNTHTPTVTFTPSNTPTVTLTPTVSVTPFTIRNGMQEIGESQFNLAWSPDGNFIAVDNYEAKILIYETRSGRLVRTLEGIYDFSVRDFEWSSDGTQIVGIGLLDFVIWDVETGEIEVDSEHELGFRSVTWTDGVSGIVTITGRQVVNWIPSTLTWFSYIDLPEIDDGAEIEWLGTEAVIYITDKAAYRVDVTGNEKLGISPDFTYQTVNTPLQLTTSPDATRFAIAERDRRVRVYDAETGQVLLTMEGHRDEIQDIDWSPDGKWIATASQDDTVRVWNANTGEEVYRLDTQYSAWGVEWSPDSSALAYLSLELNIWELPSNN